MVAAGGRGGGQSNNARVANFQGSRQTSLINGTSNKFLWFLVAGGVCCQRVGGIAGVSMVKRSYLRIIWWFV